MGVKFSEYAELECKILEINSLAKELDSDD